MEEQETIIPKVENPIITDPIINEPTLQETLAKGAVIDSLATEPINQTQTVQEPQVQAQPIHEPQVQVQVVQDQQVQVQPMQEPQVVEPLVQETLNNEPKVEVLNATQKNKTMKKNIIIGFVILLIVSIISVIGYKVYTGSTKN